VELAGSFLQHHSFTREVIVVDASKDDTAKVAGGTKVAAGVALKVIRFEEHRGKDAEEDILISGRIGNIAENSYQESRDRGA
jgi:hypothetical protein